MLQRFKICKGLLLLLIVHCELKHTESIFTTADLAMSKENALDFLKEAADNSALS